MGSTVTAQPDIGQQTTSEALENKRQVTTKPATLVSLLGTNTGVAQFIQIWDATSGTDAGAKILFTFPVPANSTFSLDTPMKFRRGILVRNASAAASASPTANAGAANCWFVTRHR